MRVTQEQKAEVVALLAQGLESSEIARSLGLGIMQVAGVKAGLTKERAQQATEVADAVQTKFGLERDLQDALRRNIEQLELGLKIVDGGKERQVDSGFIDITAEDSSGRTVVIELKAGTADRETIGQILGYMGDLQRKSEKPVRGVIVAAEFTVHAMAALGVLPNLQLKQYGFNFSFESIQANGSATVQATRSGLES